MKKTKAKVSKTISENISFKEATFSNTAKRLKIKNQPSETHIKNMKTIAEKCFQPLREWCGHPIRINSMYRCGELCEAIGSSKNSQHTKGQAIDMSSLGEKTNGEMKFHRLTRTMRAHLCLPTLSTFPSSSATSSASIFCPST